MSVYVRVHFHFRVHVHFLSFLHDVSCHITGHVVRSRAFSDRVKMVMSHCVCVGSRPGYEAHHAMSCLIRIVTVSQSTYALKINKVTVRARAQPEDRATTAEVREKDFGEGRI